ncbi:Nucleoporin p58/p45 [Rhizophlyctis rosea]|nr:Nucleoporin p58/p45 [Rhizophlyctis rosea]
MFGSFGQQPAASAAPAAGGFSFGNPTTTKPAAPAAGGFSFGAPASTAAPATGSTFGAPASSGFAFPAAPTATTASAPAFGAPAASAAPTNTLFGAAPTATTTAAATPSLFGAPATSAPAAGTGLFGSTPATTGTGLFGAQTQAPTTTATTAPGGFGFGAGGAGTWVYERVHSHDLTGADMKSFRTAGAPAAGTTTTVAAVTWQTKFSDLPQEFQKGITTMEEMIRQAIQISDTIANDQSVAKFATNITKDTTQLDQELKGLSNLLKRDEYLIDQLRIEVQREQRNRDYAGRFVERIKTAGNGKRTSNYDAYATYFEEVASDLEKRMQTYRENIEELEMTIQNTFMQHHYSPEVLQEIMKDQNRSFLAIAGRIAGVHDAIEEQKKLFADYKRKYLSDDDGRGGWGRAQTNQGSMAEMAAKVLQRSVNAPQQGQPALGQSLGASTGGGFGGGFGTGVTSSAPAATSGFGGSTFGGFGTTSTFGQPAAASTSTFGGFGATDPSKKKKAGGLQITTR